MLKPIKDASREEQLLRGLNVIEGITFLSDEFEDHTFNLGCTQVGNDPFTFATRRFPNKDILNALEQRGKYNNAIYRISHAINRPACLKNHPDWLLEIETWEKDLLEAGICDCEKELEKWYK